MKKGPLNHICIGGKKPVTEHIDLSVVYIHFENPLYNDQTLCGFYFSEEENGKLNTLSAVNCPGCIAIYKAVSKSKIENPNET